MIQKTNMIKRKIVKSRTIGLKIKQDYKATERVTLGLISYQILHQQL